ncbi:hypothetical protein BZA77DRAFT_302603 [Pyronema omphalodes]|nr:hypothetical protein BZA77DRAFT_302603 [Pyronema omphalodes]
MLMSMYCILHAGWWIADIGGALDWVNMMFFVFLGKIKQANRITDRKKDKLEGHRNTGNSGTQELKNAGNSGLGELGDVAWEFMGCFDSLFI